MRLRSSVLSVGLLPLFACGDDATVTPDARPIDAPVSIDASIDAPPTPMFKGYDADEGGELRMEYVRFAAGNAATRVTSFLFANPGTKKFHDYLSLNGCTNTSTDMVWPVATNPIAERVYLDPGNIIIAGGPMTLTLPRRATMGTDPFGRTHPANEWAFHFGGGTATDGPTYLSEKTAYDVVFTGTSEVPAQVFDNVLWMPADFALTDHGVTPLAIPADTAQTFSWTTPTQGAPAGYEVLSLVAFTGANGPAVTCIEPNDGSVTVPADMINIARAAYPSGGTLARQTLTHVVRELVDANGPTGRRIDFVSVWCYATSFTVP